jgi:Ca2+-binding RTX toxin-like protein
VPDLAVLIAGNPRLRLSGRDGSDEITAQGGHGAGVVPPLRIAHHGGDDQNGAWEADALAGGEGSDQLYGGSANDTLRGVDGGDGVSPGGGNDVADGGDGADTFDSDWGSDVLLGGSATIRSTARGGEDRLEGEGGDDTLQGDSERTATSPDPETISYVRRTARPTAHRRRRRWHGPRLPRSLGQRDQRRGVFVC